MAGTPEGTYLNISKFWTILALVFVILAGADSPVLPGSFLNIYNSIYELSPDIPEENAIIISLTLLDEYGRFGTVDPLLMVAVGYRETALQNVTGDDGGSIGYFQIQKVAVDYLCMFFDDIEEAYSQLPYHEALLSDIELQTRIAFRYMYMMAVYWWAGDIDQAIASYQGGRGDTPYYRDVIAIYDSIKGEE